MERRLALPTFMDYFLQERALASAYAAAIEDLKRSTQKDIEALRIEMYSEMQKLELRLTIKLGGMIVASIAIVAALFKLL